MDNKYLGKYDGLDTMDLEKIDVSELMQEQKRLDELELEEKLYKQQCSAPVEDIDDLLWKYEEYNAKYIDGGIYINQPVNINRFLTLKKDMNKLGIKDLVIMVA